MKDYRLELFLDHCLSWKLQKRDQVGDVDSVDDADSSSDKECGVCRLRPNPSHYNLELYK